MKCDIYVKIIDSNIWDVVICCEEESWISDIEAQEEYIWIKKELLNDALLLTRCPKYYKKENWYGEKVEYSLIEPLFNKRTVEDFKSYVMSILPPELYL